ncbi:hypothetical protein C8Q80DRAFT_1155476, partial [Daedaleopsis nitida]
MSSSRPPRGRSAPTSTRSLNSSALPGSRAKPDASSSRTAAAASRTLTTSIAIRPKVSKGSAGQLSQSRAHPDPPNRVRATTTVKGTLPAATSSTSIHPPDASKTRLRPQHASLTTEQPNGLQTAAQSCAWTYMSTSLEDELQRARTTALGTIEARRRELAAAETDIAESRIRFEAERLLDFYDELDDKKVAAEITTLISRFKAVERSISETTSAALRLVSLPLDHTTHISRYNEVLNTIDSLEDECQGLEAQVGCLSTTISANEGRLPPLLSDISTLLVGYLESVASAKGVVELCKENYCIGIETLTL